MSTTLEPTRATEPRGRRVRDQLVRVAEAATTPYLPADFMDLFAPLRAGPEPVIGLFPEAERSR